MRYKLKLDVFEGPLDLLLFLIKKNDLDISDISLVEVTDQYMAYIDMMKVLNLTIVGDFLVTAATLMQIKSRMLLPPDPVDTEEEEADPQDELTRRLLEYKRFKEAAEALQAREVARQEYFPRMIDPEERQKWRDEAKEVYYDVGLFDLINALSAALKKVPEETAHEIERDEFTVEEKIHELLDILAAKRVVKLSNLFRKARGKTEVIATFLAVLELIRLKEIKAVQKRLFEEIEIIRYTPEQNTQEVLS